jgi:methionyl-tRNA formyltransferase
MSFVVASNRPWHEGMAERLMARTGHEFRQISNPEELDEGWLNEIRAKKLFFPHWSHVLPAKIYESFECVIFHMTDLPYGRGGSPLQNLIVRGQTETILSAIRCSGGLDSGPVYLKRPLSLEGTARQIFARASAIIEDMVCELIESPRTPVPQSGEATYFKRRTPADGNLKVASSIDQIFDYIRMLDADGYPPAYFDIGDFRLSFTQPELCDESVAARVVISRRPH